MLSGSFGILSIEHEVKELWELQMFFKKKNAVKHLSDASDGNRNTIHIHMAATCQSPSVVSFFSPFLMSRSSKHLHYFAISKTRNL